MPAQLTEKQQRRKKNERANKRDRQRQGAASGKQPAKDPAYLDFIRTLPCAVCVRLAEALGGYKPQPSPTEAAHVGIRGLRQKCSDREAIPLCGWHHRESPASHHRLGKLFWVFQQLDREKLVLGYRMAFEEREQGE